MRWSHPVVPARFWSGQKFEGVEGININTAIFSSCSHIRSSSTGNINRRSIAELHALPPHAVPDSQSCSLDAPLRSCSAILTHISAPLISPERSCLAQLHHQQNQSSRYEPIHALRTYFSQKSIGGWSLRYSLTQLSPCSSAHIASNARSILSGLHSPPLMRLSALATSHFGSHVVTNHSESGERVVRITGDTEAISRPSCMFWLPSVMIPHKNRWFPVYTIRRPGSWFLSHYDASNLSNSFSPSRTASQCVPDTGISGLVPLASRHTRIITKEIQQFVTDAETTAAFFTSSVFSASSHISRASTASILSLFVTLWFLTSRKADLHRVIVDRASQLRVEIAD